MILEAATGRAGLALYRRIHPLDCMVLEIELPDMSGFEVLLKLVTSAERPQIPVDAQVFLGIHLGGGCLGFYETTDGPAICHQTESHSPIFIGSTDRSGQARVELLCSAVTVS
jgi:hypothetical protein